ncbi:MULTISPECIES: hypothetical protein [Acetobacter]|uniref:hypothetical protein n=1 Tax=Acetobacter TaxID=434 RepID=UPI0039E77FCC
MTYEVSTARRSTMLSTLRGGAVAVGGALLSVSQANAAPGYTIQQKGTGILANVASTLQDLGNFMSTTLGELACLAAFVLAAVMWAFAPKSGALSIAVRGIAATIFIFNLTSIFAYFTY